MRPIMEPTVFFVKGGKAWCAHKTSGDIGRFGDNKSREPDNIQLSLDKCFSNCHVLIPVASFACRQVFRLSIRSTVSEVELWYAFIHSGFWMILYTARVK